jgi:putative ABC transport system permease protein
MNTLHALSMAWRSLLTNKIRAFLTMLGLVIGVSAVILLVSIGHGAKNYILGEFEGLGTNLIIIQPGKSNQRGMMAAPVGAAQKKMTLLDVHALEKRSLNLEAISGLILGTVTAKFEGNASNASVFGTNEQFTTILNIEVSRGNYFSREEDDVGRRVVVLGPKIARNIFGDLDPLGHKITLNNALFQVVGITKATGDKVGINFDEFVFIPTTTAIRLFNDDKLFGIRARARSKAALQDAVAEIGEILKERRDGEEDFTILTQEALMGSMNSILSMLTYVLGAIASVSMIVGGVGIMNIMFVSVSERVSEIGIRRAVGATRAQILTQFLIEAGVISLIGGACGVLVSVGITNIFYLFMPTFDLRAPWWIVLIAFCSSMFIGIFFGVWPAKRAASIEILDALRHE